MEFFRLPLVITRFYFGSTFLPKHLIKPGLSAVASRRDDYFCLPFKDILGFSHFEKLLSDSSFIPRRTEMATSSDLSFPSLQPH